MKYLPIQAFTGVKKDVHPRALPDDKLYDARNVYFKNGKTITRPGYTQLGTNLPLSGAVLNLSEYKKLRTPGTDLLAITDDSIYQYDSTTDLWDQTANTYSTGTVNQPDTEVEFNAAATTYIASCKLTATYWAVAYRDDGDSGHGKVAMGTLAAGTASYDTAVEFNGGATTEISICCLGVDDDTTPTVAYIVIAYADTTTTYGTCIAGTVTLADGTMTFGSELAFNAYATTYTSIVKLDATRFCVAYAANTKGSAVVSSVTLATNTIAAYGTVYDFNATAVTCISMCILDSTHIVIAYIDNDNLGKSHMGLVTLATKVIDFLTYSEYQFPTGTIATSISNRMLDSTHIVICAGGNSISFIGTVILLTGVITYGSTYNFNTSFYNSMIVLDSTHIVLVCRDYNDNHGKLQIGSILGTVISWGIIYTFKSADVLTYTIVTGLSSSAFVVSFEDGGDSNHGTSMYYDRLGFKGSGTTWGTTWPDATYDIKFGTNSLTGTGTPDVWYKLHQPESTTYLVLSDDTLYDYIGNTLNLLANSAVNYIIRRSFLSSSTDYYDTANILEDISTSGETQLLLANYVDPIMIYDGSTIADLTMTEGDGGPYTAPIDSAKYAEYYHDLIVLANCIDGTTPMPQSVYWNDRGHPTYWATGTASYADLTQNGDDITGMTVFNQRLYIFKERSIVECYYTGQVDPALEFTEDKVKGIGQPHGRTIINIGNAILFKGEDNIYSFTGYQPTAIGNEIIDYINTNELDAYKSAAFAFHLKKEFLYCLAIVTSGTTPNIILVLNYMTGSWTIWQLHDNVTCFGYYGDNIVLGDSAGYVYLVDYTSIIDHATNITAYIETKDYPLNDFKHLFRLLETSIILEDQVTSTIQISYSVDFGTTWSTPVVVNQNVTENVYDHIQNHFGTGKQVRFKLENVAGSKFSLESLTCGFEDIGISIKR